MQVSWILATGFCGLMHRSFWKRAENVMQQKFKTKRSFQEEEGGLGGKADRYHLLKLVERVGKGAGFTPRMVDLLSYYLRFTREIDWEEGGKPIVYQSLAKTALDFGICERQIQKLEKALAEVGALSWRDSGNMRRYGQRCPKSGEILYAFGVDLSPLAELEERLSSLLEAKEDYARAWLEAKRQISFYRRQVRALVAEAAECSGIPAEQIREVEERYQAIVIQIRTHLKLSRLEALLREHKALFHQAKGLVEQGRSCAENCEQTEEETPKNEEKFAHINDTNQFPFNKLNTSRATPNRLARGKRGEASSPKETQSPVESHQDKRREGNSQSKHFHKGSSQESGTRQLSLKQVIDATSSRFRERLPVSLDSVSEYDLIEAAFRLCETLQISKGSWSRACQTMGRLGAAICLMLTDQAALREINPARIPGAYFNAMVNRAREGELDLKASIFAILQRQNENGAFA